MDLQTGSVDVVVALGDVLDAPRRGPEAAVRFLPYPLWATCGEDRIVLYDPARNQLRSFNSGGTETDASPLPPARRTEIDTDELVDAMLDDQWAVLRANGEDQGLNRAMVRA